MVLTSLSKINDHSCVGSFLGLQFYSIDLPACLSLYQYHAVFFFFFFFFFYHYCSVVQLEVKDSDFPRSSFIIENSFANPELFVILMNLRNALYNSMKN